MREPSQESVRAAALVLCDHRRLSELCLDQAQPGEACTERALAVLRAAASADGRVEAS